MAKEFLKKGCSVMLSGRNTEKLEKEVSLLRKEFRSDKVAGQSCDVCEIGQVRTLWNAAKKQFGAVDIWINNAGVTNTSCLLWESDPDEIRSVVNTNITGVIFGCQVSLQGMIEQGHGQIYNFEGFGSSGMMRAGMTIYGTTKRAVRYFTESMIEETEETPIQIGTIGPGMVVTDFMLDEMRRMPKEKLEEVKIVYNTLADTVETVTPYLVENVLTNDKTGTKIRWLTDEKISERFNSEEFINRDLFSRYGL
jgi:NADP-dependent 3-hydroxy acid dehydrogenase YdfG